MSTNSDDLVRAASRGDLKEFLKVLKACNDVNAGDGEALWFASWFGYAPIVMALLNAGADLHLGRDAPLRMAATRGRADVVRLLISRHADIHADHDFALRAAVAGDHLPCAKDLIAAGANIHVLDGEPLKIAMQYGLVEMSRLLLNAGATGPVSLLADTRLLVDLMILKPEMLTLAISFSDRFTDSCPPARGLTPQRKQPAARAA